MKDICVLTHIKPEIKKIQYRIPVMTPIICNTDKRLSKSATLTLMSF